MGKVIDFNQKMEERQKISIQRNKEGIKICGWNGYVFINLFNRIESKSIIKKVIKFIKNKGKKKYSGVEIREISEEECKNILYKDLKNISWKYDISKEQLEQVWLEVKQYILNSQYFQILCIFPYTFTATYVFMIK